MGLAINLLLLGVAFISFAIAGGFITNCAVRITDIPGYKTNKDLSDSHYYSSLASIITWTSIAFLLVGIFLYIFFGSETISFTEKFVVFGLLVICLLGNITVGILSAITASKISSSGVKDNNLSYRQAIIATLIGIFVFVLLVTFIIIRLTYKPKTQESKESSSIETLIGTGSVRDLFKKETAKDLLKKEIGTDPELKSAIGE